MVALSQDVISGRNGAEHIPTLPLWVLIVRGFQLVSYKLIPASMLDTESALASCNHYPSSFCLRR
jgi:hypothetical protein